MSRHRTIRWHVLLAISAGSLLSGAAINAQTRQPTHTIDLNKRHQTIDHFAASDCWSMQKIGDWSLENRNTIADLLFSTEKGIGLSMWRFNIGGGINNRTISDPWRTVETFEIAPGQYDWSRQANQRWFLAAAKQRGVNKFLAFVNSPPGRMTRSGLTNAGLPEGGYAQGSSNLLPGMETQFATYLADILQHFRDNPDPSQRIEFEWVSPVNEPSLDWTSGQEGNRAANDDIKRIVLALHQELQRRNLKTKILIPESNTIHDMLAVAQTPTARHGAIYGNYIEAFCKDPQIAPLLNQTLCYHGYGSDGDDQLIPLRQQLRARIDQFPGWRLWQSEYCVMRHRRDLSMSTALRVARIIHCDLTIANASGWSWWLAVSPYDYKDGLIYTDWKKPGDPETIITSKLLWAVGNFSRFIRPGFVRLDVTGPNDDLKGLMCSAYCDPAGKRLVIICINSSNHAIPVEFSIVGGEQSLMPTEFTPFITSDSPGQDLKQHPTVSSDQTFQMPARSVVTLVGDIRK